MGINERGYPALASVQYDDVRLKQGYKKIVILMTMMLFPAILFAAALAGPIFDILLPEKWAPAVPYFQLLCIASVMLPLHSINLNILKVKGRSDLFLYLEIIKKTITGLMLLATYRYGVYAIIFGQIATSIINYIPNSYFSYHLIGYSIKEQLTDFVPALLLSTTIAGLIFILQDLLEWWPLAELVVFSALAGLLYLMGAHFLKLSAYELTKELLMKKLKNKGQQ